MAEVISLDEKRNEDRKSGAETCAMLYESLNFDPSNVVFAPGFSVLARAAYDKNGSLVKEAS